MNPRGLSRRFTHRWGVVGAILLLVFALAEFSLSESERLPDLGLEMEARDGRYVVARVHAAGLAFDAGVRRGDVVVAVDGRPVRPDAGAVTLDGATSVEVVAAGEERRFVSVAQATPLSNQRRVGFLLLVVSFMALGSVVFLMAKDLVPASLFLGLAISASVGLLASLAAAARAPWAQVLVAVGLACASACCLLFFLVFPVNRLKSIWGQTLAALSVCASAALVVACLWTGTVDSNGFPAVRSLLFLMVALDLAVVCALAIHALLYASPRQGEERRAFAVTTLGTIAGLLPFALLSLVPRVLAGVYLVPPDVSILGAVLVPGGVGLAVLDRQFPGIRMTMQRGLVALAVWLGLVSLYSVVLSVAFSLPAASVVVAVGFIAGTFPVVEGRLRRRLEGMFFRDIYHYATTLQRLAAEIVTLVDLPSVARCVLDRLTGTLDLEWAALAVRAEDAEPLVFTSPNCPPGVAPALREAVERGASNAEPMVAPGVGDGTYALPLASEGVSFGTLLIGPKRREIDLTPEDRALVATLTPLIASALRNRLLVRSLEGQVAALQEREATLAALSGRLIRLQEEERRQLALDLHDDPLQRAIMLARSVGDASERAQTALWRQAAEEIVASLRAICSELRPPVLDDLGLIAGLESLVSGVRARSDLDVTLSVDGAGRLEPALEGALYRVAQEALNNCVRHARATRVQVDLTVTEQRVTLTVTDNGRGLEEDNGKRSVPKLGIIGMRERLRPWMGKLSVGAAPGGGTMVVATVDLGGNDAG